MAILRQFLLLLWKDWVLVRRNKLWTFFEIVIPLLITLPIVILVVRNANINLAPEIEHESFTLRGDAEDVTTSYGHTKTIIKRWCNRNDVILGYTTASASFNDEAAMIMKRLSERFASGRVNVQVDFKNDEETLKQTLKDDAPNGTYCAINKYIGGVVFDNLNVATRVLEYRILMPTAVEEQWHMDESWNKGRSSSYSKSRIPAEPPYWSSGFLTIQYAIESSFVERVTNEEMIDTPLNLQAFTEPKFSINSVAEFIDLLPILWGICVFTTVLHVGREIAAEKAGVKPFLSAMGLSTPMFYLTHVIFAFAKCLIIFLACAIPITTVMKFVSPSLFLAVVFLYGLGAVTFGALIASIFKTSNSALKALIILWCASIGLAFKLQPKIDQIFACFAYSLNVNGAFFMAAATIKDHMNREKPLTWGNLFEGSTLQFSLGYAILMLLFNILWMAALTLLLDFILSPLDFDIRSFFRKKETDEMTHTDGVTASNTRANENMMPTTSQTLPLPSSDADYLLEGSTQVDGARDSAVAGIDVSRLVKIWSSTGERAVDGLSLRAVRGQVAVLLGHNGAGKSTTFASIAGIIKPTSGSISICGHDVASELGECRKKIGLCPQYNPLYDKLTVEEHLWLIYGLKGAQMELFKDEEDELLEHLKLDDKRNELSMNLSGGMKRKLCVCMALIGQSEVVLLDEPTAGMDPGARKDVQAILEKEKAQRTILLTTHYMDEAERLGDWVLIMSYGRLVASGSNQYLKHRFGTGYLLTVVFDHKSDKKVMGIILEQICQAYVEEAKKGEQHGQQIEMILPEKSKTQFVSLFRALEAVQQQDYNSRNLARVSTDTLTEIRKHNFNITNFGLSLNTLEQVFLRVGDLAEEKERMSRQASYVSRSHSGVSSLQVKTNYDTQQSTKSEDSYNLLIESQMVAPQKRGFKRVWAQYCAIFRKRILYSMRNWPQLISQVVVPLILLGLVVMISNWTRTKEDEARHLSMDSFGSSRVVLHGSNGSSTFARNFETAIKSCDFTVERYPITYPLNNISNDLAGELPAPGFGAAFMDDGSYLGYFNYYAYHSLPTIVSAVSQARLPQGKGTISASMYLYSKYSESGKIFSGTIIDMFLSPLLVLVFAMLTSTFVMFLIEERVSQFAHQQSLTGISPFVFWSASLLFDLIFYAIVCTIFLLMFIFFNWMHGYLGLVTFLWLLYFFACVPFIYSVSFLFSSPSKANVLLIMWQIVASFAAMFIMIVVATVIDIDASIKEFIRFILLFLLPSFSFGTALITINTSGIMMTFNELLQWDNLGKNIVCMALFGVASSTLFLALQFKQVRRYLQSLWWRPRRTMSNAVESAIPHDLPVCPSVEKERELVTTGNTLEHAMVVKHLTKMYGRYAAVNDLCLAVTQKECFGLLGVNGAGKTTTFNILTGQAFATTGDATIGGRDVTEQIAIGYCPQFDALMLDYTGRETLEILAQMHGFDDYKKKADIILLSVGMAAHADKLVRYYSGGQKRKISVGVALLAPTQMIILDEPTAGIDPKARREIWELLLRVREHSNSALLLTSHSMDECEALCSRIAVLNKGSLIAIGTSQDLKSLYGNNYTMTLTLKSDKCREKVVEKVRQRFPESILKTHVENKTLTLKWQIKKEVGDKWSEKFKEVEDFANDPDIEDFCLAQTSLEDTFLRLAGIDDDQTDSGARSNTVVTNLTTLHPAQML